METIELKFLLKLLGFPNYQAPLAKIAPTSKTSAADRERICRHLRDRELVTCSYDIGKIKITPSGKELLESDSDEVSLTSEELATLNACEKKAITPGKTGIPAAERQTVIESLADRGLIQVDQKIRDVWLTERGQECLQKEYEPRGKGNITLTKTMLAGYLHFLRQSQSPQQSEVESTATAPSQEATRKLSDEEILQAIEELDRRLRRKYLPIFYLREKLEPPLLREDLDRALFRLEESGKIELSAITRGWRYTPEEFNAGIPQRAGSRLFFVTLK